MPPSLSTYADNISFRTLCGLLGLEGLKSLDLGLVQKLDALEADWAHTTDDAAWEKKSEQEKEKVRAILEARASRDMKVSLQMLRDFYPASAVEPAVDSGSVLTVNQAAATLDDLATLAEAARPLPLPQTALCLSDPNPYPDSGYATDSGENLALTQIFNTACYTETPVAPESLEPSSRDTAVVSVATTMQGSSRNQSSSPRAVNHRETPGTLTQVPLTCRQVDIEDSQPAAKRQKTASFQTPSGGAQGVGNAANMGSAVGDRTASSEHDITEFDNDYFELLGHATFDYQDSRWDQWFRPM